MVASLQQSLIDELRPVISEERLGTYLTAAGFDVDRALKLYVWNAQIGEAFHLPIQAAEVALRNRVSIALTAQFGSDWWKRQPLLDVLDDGRKTDIEVVLRRMRDRKQAFVPGQVVAGLSFGFWVGMLQRRYHPAIWSTQLRTTFPDLPTDRNRGSLATTASRTVWLRNRIWHHEPIIKLDLSAEYGKVMMLLAWISPAKANWVRPYCRVPILLRQKP